MSEYIVKNIKTAEKYYLQTGVFLVLMHAGRVPPHIFMTVGGKMFSLSVRGATIGSDIEVLLRAINKQRAETLFMQLQVPEVCTMQQLNETVTKVVSAYPRADVGLATCLAPVKDFCHNVYNTPVEDVEFIFDLLPRLEQQGIIGECYHFYLERKLTEHNSFRLRTYSMFDINESIIVARGKTVNI